MAMEKKTTTIDDVKNIMPVPWVFLDTMARLRYTITLLLIRMKIEFCR
jgi:hypothetical protein